MEKDSFHSQFCFHLKWAETEGRQKKILKVLFLLSVESLASLLLSPFLTRFHILTKQSLKGFSVWTLVVDHILL